MLGYPELFKIRGWMDYLGIDKARFIVQEIADKPIESIKEEMKTLDIEVIVNNYDKFKGELRNEELCESLGLNCKEIPDQTIEMLCYSFLIEDLMCSKLIRSYKESDIDNGKIGYDRLFSYLQRIKHSSFFISDPQIRAARIFDTYASNVNITAKIALERKGEDFEKLDNSVSIPSDIFKQIFYIPQKKCGYHVALYVELLNKLLIVKCCTDYQIAKQFKKDESSLPVWMRQLQGAKLPQHLLEGINIISKDPYYYLYPHFWQIFVYLFGGFILEDMKENEYKHLSSLTGIPVEYIDNALNSFNILFKTEGDWFFNMDGIRCMKLFPSPFSGIGANFRHQLYVEKKESTIEDLQKIISQKVYDRLVSWNNLAVAFLETDKNIVV